MDLRGCLLPEVIHLAPLKFYSCYHEIWYDGAGYSCVPSNENSALFEKIGGFVEVFEDVVLEILQSLLQIFLIDQYIKILL